jgi:hypothetical protein
MIFSLHLQEVNDWKPLMFYGDPIRSLQLDTLYQQCSDEATQDKNEKSIIRSKPGEYTAYLQE